MIIDKMSEKIALTFKRINPEETASVEVMKFSLALILNFAFIFLFSSIIGLLLGTFWATLLSLFAFGMLRFVSGGVHLPVSEYCVAVSTAIFVIIPHLPINDMWCIILNIVSLVLVLLFAPSRIENQSRIPRKYYPMLKVIAAVMVALNFWFMSGVLAITYFIQSTLLIRRLKV